MDRIVRTIVGRRASLLVVVVATLLAAFGFATGADTGSTSAQYPDAQLPRGAESTSATLRQESLPTADTSAAVVLFTADSGTLTPDDLAAVGERVGALTGVVEGAQASPLIPSEDGSAAIVTLALPATSASTLSEEVAELRATARDGLPDGVTAQLTGPAGIQADLAEVFEGADFRLLGATALVVAVLLVVTYRSPGLWVVPLLTVGITDRLASITAAGVLDAAGLPLDESTTGILSVLVFGAGTDYALLLISRYRDELRREADRFRAMRHALRRTAEAVLASSSTVVLAALALLLSLTPGTRALGLASAVGIVLAAFAGLVVLPALLVLFGRFIFWPLVPRVGDAATTERRTVWSRVGGLVGRRPATLAVATVALLAALSSGALGIRTGLSDADQFTRTPEAISAAERLGESFPAGASDPAIIITTPAQAATVETLAAGVAGVDAVGEAGRTDDLVRLDAVLAAAPGSAEARDTVVALREALADVPATDVGGSDAQSVDERAGAVRDLTVIVPVVLALVLLVLVGLLRSLLAPVLLVATVVGTFVASLGLSWWVFSGLLGQDALDVQVPLLSFLFLVALGVDYNIFLVTRAREEAAHHGTRTGVLRALTATGGVITSAGVLLAAVFAVLGVLPLVVLAQIGTVIGIGVLLDTLLVRTVLVPALAVWLGDRFWWPGRPPRGDHGRHHGSHDGSRDGRREGRSPAVAAAPPVAGLTDRS
ncbi:MMPL family transporter [Cellulomonas marina]|uniref:Putative drug exporter of the RND superfamily n=1 Tax=Cellulomonas marina TaxID=988821 RepID=A0A1I0Z7V5_9CELL|nr:MMPL family transporter [Cellulomonas marina]GIG29051.1 membrane protein [Cellulomonas marina]SFB21601.1 putative drug exporter of the RND superfamily [Cellulomonas marina]